MDWASIIGRIAGGFALKAAVIVGAVYLALEVYAYVSSVFNGVGHVLQ